MTDYLTNIAAKSLNLANILRPRPRSAFEPLSSDALTIAPSTVWDGPEADMELEEGASTSNRDLMRISSDIREGIITGDLIPPSKDPSLELKHSSPISEGMAKKRQEKVADSGKAEIQDSGVGSQERTSRTSIELQSARSWKDQELMTSDIIHQELPDEWDGSKPQKERHSVNSGIKGDHADKIYEIRVDHRDNASLDLNREMLSSKEKIDSIIASGNIASSNINSSINPEIRRIQKSEQLPMRGPSEPAERMKIHKEVESGDRPPAQHSEILRISDYIRASSYSKLHEPAERQIAGGEILVSIGRIDVRSSSREAMPQRRQSASPGSSPISLNEYNYRRARGGIG